MASGKKRIAVIDDSELVLAAVEDALIDAGFEVAPMTEPDRDALTSADLVLIDVNMPQVYGDEAVGFLKEAWGIAGPVYLYSGAREDELRERTDAAGADGYICKEWGMARLVEVVTAVVSRGVVSGGQAPAQ